MTPEKKRKRTNHERGAIMLSALRALQEVELAPSPSMAWAEAQKSWKQGPKGRIGSGTSEAMSSNLRENPSWNEENEALFGPDLTSARGQFFSCCDLGRTQPSPTLELAFDRARESRTEDRRQELNTDEEPERKEVDTTQPLSQLTKS
ncbi:hypothetical protein VM1G_12075 [Cytospora mali]|uniref:Uncharacterized protein n=1 Tax=Cytospora mali TaxID=578113 RepID=A0A194VJX3_CYTMA|nr:hypothetical protein VM1G_12075 [Valsa mali]